MGAGGFFVAHPVWPKTRKTGTNISKSDLLRILLRFISHLLVKFSQIISLK
jgi:hypothetical protein